MWLRNISTDPPDIKQVKPLKTKPHKRPIKNNHPGHAFLGEFTVFLSDT